MLTLYNLNRKEHLKYERGSTITNHLTCSLIIEYIVVSDDDKYTLI